MQTLVKVAQEADYWKQTAAAYRAGALSSVLCPLSSVLCPPPPLARCSVLVACRHACVHASAHACTHTQRGQGSGEED